MRKCQRHVSHNLRSGIPVFSLRSPKQLKKNSWSQATCSKKKRCALEKINRNFNRQAQVDRWYFIQLLHTWHCPVCTERVPTLLLARHTSNCTRTGEILELYPSQHCERKIESCLHTAHASASYTTKHNVQSATRWVERNTVLKRCVTPKNLTQLF